jgi:uncharacterized protein (TIGR03118 family)
VDGPHVLRAALLAGAVLLAGRPLAAQSRFAQRNLVSDVPGLAAHLDPDLVNPWGISFGPATPFWISDAGKGITTLYNGAGVRQALFVTIPGPGGPVPSVPTGQVFNSAGAAFDLPGLGPARFIFAGATGTISGWNPTVGTTPGVSAIQVANGFPAAAYTGLAIAGSGAGARLYAANFGQGTVDVFDQSFAPIAVAGGFADPTLPAGYAPFNVETIGGSVYVTYALVDPATGEDLPGAGHGFVNVFDTDGNLVRRLVSDGALNSPWGLALAPASFGSFGGALLVGNFGDGTIHAYDQTTGALLGQLLDPFGAPLVNEGLWALKFGNAGPGLDPNTLYFTAGIDDETHGLFASLAPVPEPGTLALAGSGLALLLGAGRRRRARG